MPRRPLRVKTHRSPGSPATSGLEGTPEGIGSKSDIGPGESEAGGGPDVRRTWPERANVAEAVAAEGQEIEKKFITIAGGIVKRLGKYNASVRLHRDVIVDLPFDVVAEK